MCIDIYWVVGVTVWVLSVGFGAGLAVEARESRSDIGWLEVLLIIFFWWGFAGFVYSGDIIRFFRKQ